MRATGRNLWILTEERPKKESLEQILKLFARDQRIGFVGGDLRVIPLFDTDTKSFSFTYELIGFSSPRVNKIYIKTISGYSSFVDYLVYYQDELPKPTDTPLYAIEETKTDDKESRNTGVYQRCSKFVYIKRYYPETKLVMLYSLQIPQKEKPTKTYIFGTRLLLTLGVTIIGKELDAAVFKPFENIKELIECKASMGRPNSTNTPILITQEEECLYISGKLVKSGNLAHDPNIGALSIISAVLRLLGWSGEIVITQHGLRQQQVGDRNKFVQVCKLLGVELHGLALPETIFPEEYWYYDTKGEKLATIFLHLVVEAFSEGYSIFENHAGCEKSYFVSSKGECIALSKYSDREQYKAGDKSKIINIPDLVLLDIKDQEVITIEGKKYENRFEGIQELSLYDDFEKRYLDQYYKGYTPIRSVVLYGGEEQSLIEVEVGFLLNKRGQLVLGLKAPALFTRAITNFLDYWGEV